jgi:molecular chaperone GrpE
VSGHERVDSEREGVSPAGAAPQPPAYDESDAAAQAAADAAGGGEPASAAESDAAIADFDSEPVEGGVEVEVDPTAEAQALADRYLDLAQRTQADFDNYRKRMTREVRAAEARGIGRLARELLPALDNIERALAAVEAADPDHHLSQGVKLLSAELSAALGRTGIQGYDPTGEAFDPVQHEAVAQQPVEGTEAGTIVQVLQSGYRLNEAILRPARVIVAS